MKWEDDTEKAMEKKVKEGKLDSMILTRFRIQRRKREEERKRIEAMTHEEREREDKELEQKAIEYGKEMIEIFKSNEKEFEKVKLGDYVIVDCPKCKQHTLFFGRVKYNGHMRLHCENGCYNVIE